jgi:hypothetical protein
VIFAQLRSQRHRPPAAPQSTLHGAATRWDRLAV